MAGEVTPWLPTHGRKPDLPGSVFVFVRYQGETRQEVEVANAGYGQSIDSVANWSETIEYRCKRAADSTANAPDNPSAFPEVPGDFNAYEGRPGMSLRDWFAGQAPHGAFVKDNGPHNPVTMAKAAYAYADAMLAERAKGGGR